MWILQNDPRVWAGIFNLLIEGLRRRKLVKEWRCRSGVNAYHIFLTETMCVLTCLPSVKMIVEERAVVYKALKKKAYKVRRLLYASKMEKPI